MVLTVLLLQATQYQATFTVAMPALVSDGKNAYMSLTPGSMPLTLVGGGTKLVVTVLAKTARVDGVECRIVEERETHNGKLVEVSRNFFARDKATDDIYYFGEDVDIYTNGKVTSHDSAWRSGVQGATFGLFLPGAPRVGQAWYQEIAPKVALDRVLVATLDHTLKTAVGEFRGCLWLKESTPLEPGAEGTKVYAPGIGLVQDDELLLAELPG